MLYYLLVPLAKDHILFNVFRYLTFRSFMALISAFIISLLVGPWLIRRLRAAQHGGETIREDTPERHRTKKGTPTMGGIVILTAILATTLLWANLANRYVWVVILATAGFGIIGVWDDMTKLRTRKGLPSRGKFGAQGGLALAVLQLGYWRPPGRWPWRCGNSSPGSRPARGSRCWRFPSSRAGSSTWAGSGSRLRCWSSSGP